MVKSPTYWDADRVKLNGLNFYSIESISTADRAFRAGQLHITQSVPLDRIPSYRREEPQVLQISPLLGVCYYVLNVTRKPLDDPRVRLALSLAVDRESLVRNVLRAIQRQVNDKNKPEASSYRVLLADAFSEAVELRGGGSGSGQLLTFAPAHEEWIIAHLGTAQEDDLSDEVFVSRLRKSLTVGESPERHRVQAVLEKLKAVERFLKASEAAFLRQEFLAYFER